ncbi:MAG: hypothetical protein R6X33_00155 [Candidatus Brocadiia bacterium]
MHIRREGGDVHVNIAVSPDPGEGQVRGVPLLSIEGAAALAGVDPRTVRAWIRRGEVDAFHQVGAFHGNGRPVRYVVRQQILDRVRRDR